MVKIAEKERNRGMGNTDFDKLFGNSIKSSALEVKQPTFKFDREQMNMPTSVEMLNESPEMPQEALVAVSGNESSNQQKTVVGGIIKPSNERDTNFLKVLLKHQEFKAQYEQMMNSLGQSLIVLEEADSPILDREKEMKQMIFKMNRPKNRVVLLLGQAGLGKTALVEEFIRVENEKWQKGKTKDKHIVFSLELGKMAADGIDKLKVRLEGLIPRLKEIEQQAQKIDPNIKFTLFIDEVHTIITIFGVGTKIGGDLLKRTLARAPITVIAATTNKEYDNTIATDEPLARRFKPIQMKEVSPETVMKIAKSWWSQFDFPIPSDDVLERVIRANALYRQEFAEPAKTLDILEDFIAHLKLNGGSITMDVVNQIFYDSYSINLSLDFDYQQIYRAIRKGIIGQPFAMESLRKMIQSLSMRLDPMSKKPLATVLMAGVSGTGKSETVKQLAAALYPTENVMLKINMPDYSTKQSEGAFRKRLGLFVRRMPNALILFDEFEKAHQNVQDAFLAILDDGEVSFEQVTREGDKETVTVSLKNTIVFATTNAGAKVFKNDAKYMSSTLADSFVTNELIATLKNHLLAMGWRPEMINRFSRILPYRDLTNDNYIEIAQAKLEKLFKDIYYFRGVVFNAMKPVEWWKDFNPTYHHVANDITLFTVRSKRNANPSLGGARVIENCLGESGELFDTIIDTMLEYPDCKEFHVSVSKDAKIWDDGNSPKAGAYEVIPQSEWNNKEKSSQMKVRGQYAHEN